MGFGMIRISFVSSLVLFMVGCIKEPKTEIVYGPEVPSQKLASTLQEAMGVNDSPGLIRKEEFVGREATRLIRGRPVLDIMGTTEVTVVERTETATQWQINDVEKIQNYDPSDATKTPPPIIREDHKCWSKESLDREECEIPTRALLENSLAPRSLQAIQPFSVFQQSTSSPEKTVTFHNLAVTQFQDSPPEDVKKDPACGNIPNCQINVTQIEFDRVNWASDPNGYKIHYKLKVSQDVPQMSRILESCQQGSVQILQPGGDPKTAPRLLVTFCDTVKNFLPGIE